MHNLKRTILVILFRGVNNEHAGVMYFFNITSDQHKHSLIFVSMVSYGERMEKYPFWLLLLNSPSCALISNEAEPVLADVGSDHFRITCKRGQGRCMLRG